MRKRSCERENKEIPSHVLRNMRVTTHEGKASHNAANLPYLLHFPHFKRFHSAESPQTFAFLGYRKLGREKGT